MITQTTLLLVAVQLSAVSQQWILKELRARQRWRRSFYFQEALSSCSSSLLFVFLRVAPLPHHCRPVIYAQSPHHLQPPAVTPSAGVCSRALRQKWLLFARQWELHLQPATAGPAEGSSAAGFFRVFTVRAGGVQSHQRVKLVVLSCYWLIVVWNSYIQKWHKITV